MLYHQYGSTGIEVSAIGFGGMRLENIKNEQACVELVLAAYDAGINYFDTAPIYCQSKSESRFGAAFAEMKKTRSQKPFWVATKTFAASPADIRKDLERSLARLQVDCIDFYHAWCIIRPEDYHSRKAKGMLKTFEKLRDEGLIRYICVSTHMNGQDIAMLLQDYPFTGVLLGYSVMNFAYREEAIQTASKMGRAVVVMNPLGGGLIPQYPERFSFVKTQENENVVEGALRFLINDPRISVSLVGFGNKSHLQQALNAVDGYCPISEEQITRIRQELHISFNQLCTACRYCDHCPEKIPVPQLMDAYNNFLLTGNKQRMLERLQWHWSILQDKNYLDRCTGCGLCESCLARKNCRLSSASTK